MDSAVAVMAKGFGSLLWTCMYVSIEAQCTDPPDPEVARTPNPENGETPGQQGFHASHDT
jgi:hypothetical protein